MSNRYSRIFHHISTDDLKRNREITIEKIEKGKKIPGIDPAIRFAKEHRAIGLGISAFHSYLQKNMVEFGSLESLNINRDIFSTIDDKQHAKVFS